jgi:hypothetical protein
VEKPEVRELFYGEIAGEDNRRIHTPGIIGRHGIDSCDRRRVAAEKLFWRLPLPSIMFGEDGSI